MCSTWLTAIPDTAQSRYLTKVWKILFLKFLRLTQNHEILYSMISLQPTFAFRFFDPLRTNFCSQIFSLSTRVSAFISLALVVVLVVQNNNYRISNFNRIRLYLTQIIILKLIQVILDQLLILNAIKLDPILFYIKHDWGNILWISCYYVFLLHTKKSHKLCTERPNECYFCKGVKFYSRP